jgi:hypothetical protein
VREVCQIFQGGWWCKKGALWVAGGQMLIQLLRYERGIQC